MRPRAFGALLPLVVMVGCGGPTTDPAGQCREVVRIHRHLGDVVIIGRPVESSEGRVEIRYEGVDSANAPVKGTASCTFAVGDAGTLDLVEANVDGSELDPGAIDSLRKELGEPS